MHAHGRLGHQLYPILEQCKKPEVLGPSSRQGTRLGIRRNEKYVLGRPCLFTVMPEGPAISPDDAEDTEPFPVADG
jgi:hypothetical protein